MSQEIAAVPGGKSIGWELKDVCLINRVSDRYMKLNNRRVHSPPEGDNISAKDVLLFLAATGLRRKI